MLELENLTSFHISNVLKEIGFPQHDKYGWIKDKSISHIKTKGIKRRRKGMAWDFVENLKDYNNAQFEKISAFTLENLKKSFSCKIKFSKTYKELKHNRKLKLIKAKISDLNIEAISNNKIDALGKCVIIKNKELKK